MKAIISKTKVKHAFMIITDIFITVSTIFLDFKYSIDDPIVKNQILQIRDYRVLTWNKRDGDSYIHLKYFDMRQKKNWAYERSKSCAFWCGQKYICIHSTLISSSASTITFQIVWMYLHGIETIRFLFISFVNLGVDQR